ncbi:MAG TPA: hypothetical protein VNN07_05980 [Candidatus Tectomicrobia bacterium]|nr:hypothetical protein [Candidatus Tectomicrobia bacterium]
MRGGVVTNPLTWRVPHWLMLVAVAAYAAVYSEIFRPGDVAVWFASRPEVAEAFREPHFGRADALILVFSMLFLGPLAVLLAALCALFFIGLLGGVLLPIVRWFRLPDGLATLLALGGVVLAATLSSAQWLPSTVWFVGLLARACLIVFAV